MYNEKDFAIKLPKYLTDEIKKLMEKYSLSLSDAVKEAFRNKVKSKNTLWYKAWYFDDYREIIPSAYLPKYLDFEKYPLKYKQDSCLKE